MTSYFLVYPPTFFCKMEQLCNCTSLGFNVKNGVRKGLSLVFINIYIDGLSKELNMLKAGCIINGVIANHLIYADDTVLISPSPCNLQELHVLNVCKCYGKLNVIK